MHSDADLDLAAQRIAFGGYYQAGQSCISVQRVLVASEVYDDFAVRLTKQVEQLKVGDPMDPTVDVGPVIDSGRGRPDRRWVEEAEAQGAEVLTGGKADGPFFQPTLLSRTTPEMKVRCEEVFGPVVTISPYETFEDALAEVNNSKYGLQAGVFTNDINRALRAHRTLEVGGVIINDVSAFRADQMPYGGSKDSGFGREGLRFAMEEMTEPRIMVLSHVPREAARGTTVSAKRRPACRSSPIAVLRVPRGDFRQRAAPPVVDAERRRYRDRCMPRSPGPGARASPGAAVVGSPWLLGERVLRCPRLFVWPGLFGGAFIVLPFVWIRRPRREPRMDPRTNGHARRDGTASARASEDARRKSPAMPTWPRVSRRQK